MDNDTGKFKKGDIELTVKINGEHIGGNPIEAYCFKQRRTRLQPHYSAYAKGHSKVLPSVSQFKYWNGLLKNSRKRNCCLLGKVRLNPSHISVGGPFFA